MTTDPAPLISHLVTVRNKAHVVGETIEALLNQRPVAAEAEREIVVVDDASTDNSLAVLEAAARRDARVRVIAMPENVGPSISLNAAAAAARGVWLHPVDGDDVPPPNAVAWMARMAERREASLVFGASRRGLDPAPIPDDAEGFVIDDPLAFVARRQITRMGFLARADLWRAAGGCDETVFIQDQSLPLRLALAASRTGARMVWTDAVIYRLRPPDAGALSNRRAQQSHDRFLSAAHALREAPDGEGAKALKRMALSALWKLRRERGRAPWASAAFARYALNRSFGLAPGRDWFERQADALAATPGILRPASHGAGDP